MVIKTFLVTYAYGHLNPSERKIEIETTNELTEGYIIQKIEEKFPTHKGQISAILSTLLIKEEELKNPDLSQKDDFGNKFEPKDEENLDEVIKKELDNNLPKSTEDIPFNWDN